MITIIKIACLLNRLLYICHMRSNRLAIWINTQISNMERARVMEAYSKLEEIEKLFERGKFEEKDK
jgi:hypothetical protein